MSGEAGTRTRTLYPLTPRFCSRLNSSPASRHNVQTTYEFALSHVGQEQDSGAVFACDTTQTFGKFLIPLLSLPLLIPLTTGFMAYTWMKSVGRYDDAMTIHGSQHPQVRLSLHPNFLPILPPYPASLHSHMPKHKSSKTSKPNWSASPPQDRVSLTTKLRRLPDIEPHLLVLDPFKVRCAHRKICWRRYESGIRSRL